jgi:hypothetical protein
MVLDVAATFRTRAKTAYRQLSRVQRRVGNCAALPSGFAVFVAAMVGKLRVAHPTDLRLPRCWLLAEVGWETAQHFPPALRCLLGPRWASCALPTLRIRVCLGVGYWLRSAGKLRSISQRLCGICAVRWASYALPTVRLRCLTRMAIGACLHQQWRVVVEVQSKGADPAQCGEPQRRLRPVADQKYPRRGAGI